MELSKVTHLTANKHSTNEQKEAIFNDRKVLVLISSHLIDFISIFQSEMDPILKESWVLFTSNINIVDVTECESGMRILMEFINHGKATYFYDSVLDGLNNIGSSTLATKLAEIRNSTQPSMDALSRLTDAHFRAFFCSFSAPAYKLTKSATFITATFTSVEVKTIETEIDRLDFDFYIKDKNNFKHPLFGLVPMDNIMGCKKFKDLFEYCKEHNQLHLIHFFVKRILVPVNHTNIYYDNFVRNLGKVIFEKMSDINFKLLPSYEKKTVQCKQVKSTIPTITVSNSKQLDFNASWKINNTFLGFITPDKLEEITHIILGRFANAKVIDPNDLVIPYQERYGFHSIICFQTFINDLGADLAKRYAFIGEYASAFGLETPSPDYTQDLSDESYRVAKAQYEVQLNYRIGIESETLREIGWLTSITFRHHKYGTQPPTILKMLRDFNGADKLQDFFNDTSILNNTHIIALADQLNRLHERNTECVPKPIYYIEENPVLTSRNYETRMVFQLHKLLQHDKTTFKKIVDKSSLCYVDKTTQKDILMFYTAYEMKFCTRALSELGKLLIVAGLNDVPEFKDIIHHMMYKPSNPEYGSETRRAENLKTYNPDESVAWEIAEAGFYFNSTRKCLECFHCGIKIRQPNKKPDNLTYLDHHRVLAGGKCDYINKTINADTQLQGACCIPMDVDTEKSLRDASAQHDSTKKELADLRNQIPTCRICWDHFLAKDENHDSPVTLGCHHVFHRDCIIENMKHNGTRCPECRREYNFSNAAKLYM